MVTDFSQYDAERQAPRDRLAAIVAEYRRKQAEEEAGAVSDYNRYAAQQEQQQNENLAQPALQGAQIGGSIGGGYGALGGAAGGLGLGMLRSGIEAQKQGKSPFAAIGRGLLDIPKNLLGGDSPNAAANAAQILATQQAMDNYRKSQLTALANRAQQTRPMVTPGAGFGPTEDFRFSRQGMTRREPPAY